MNLVRVYHVGPYGCKQLACYFRRRLVRDGLVTVDNVVKLDGTSYQYGDKLKCGYCKDVIDISKGHIRQEGGG